MRFDAERQEGLGSRGGAEGATDYGLPVMQVQSAFPAEAFEALQRQDRGHGDRQAARRDRAAGRACHDPRGGEARAAGRGEGGAGGGLAIHSSTGRRLSSSRRSEPLLRACRIFLICSLRPDKLKGFPKGGCHGYGALWARLCG